MVLVFLFVLIHPGYVTSEGRAKRHFDDQREEKSSEANAVESEDAFG